MQHAVMLATVATNAAIHCWCCFHDVVFLSDMSRHFHDKCYPQCIYTSFLNLVQWNRNVHGDQNLYKNIIKVCMVISQSAMDSRNIKLKNKRGCLYICRYSSGNLIPNSVCAFTNKQTELRITCPLKCLQLHVLYQ